MTQIYIINYNPLNPNNLAKTLYHFHSCMILACVGDTIGYNNGKWEFNYDCISISEDLRVRTDGKGILALRVDKEQWIYSDDTAMHMATAKGLLNSKQTDSIDNIVRSIAIFYKISMNDMKGRAPGKTTMQLLQKLKQNGQNWNKFQYNQRGRGCGGSMRVACIGLVYFDIKQLDKLIQVAIQSTRVTHHNPIAYIGAVMVAYFAALGIRRINPKIWMYYFYKQKVLERVQSIIKKKKRNVKQNLAGEQWKIAVQKLVYFCKNRCIPYLQNQPPKISKIQPYFSPDFITDTKKRQRQWYEYSFGNGWIGAVGIDCVLIALDSLLYSEGNYEQICMVSMIHGGDNDSTGTIALAWYGAYYGMKEVPENHYKQMEGFKEVTQLGSDLFYRFCNKTGKEMVFVGEKQSFI